MAIEYLEKNGMYLIITIFFDDRRQENAAGRDGYTRIEHHHHHLLYFSPLDSSSLNWQSNPLIFVFYY